MHDDFFLICALGGALAAYLNWLPDRKSLGLVLTGGAIGGLLLALAVSLIFSALLGFSRHYNKVSANELVPSGEHAHH